MPSVVAGLRIDHSISNSARLYGLLVLHIGRQPPDLQKATEPALHGMLSKLCSILDDSRYHHI